MLISLAASKACIHFLNSSSSSSVLLKGSLLQSLSAFVTSKRMLIVRFKLRLSGNASDGFVIFWTLNRTDLAALRGEGKQICNYMDNRFRIILRYRAALVCEAAVH